jgi:methylthioribose-1-phosphate isomerase
MLHTESPYMTKFRTIWTTEDRYVEVIDQRKLPHEFVTVRLETYDEAEEAIKDMTVRGAPLIGATAAYGIYLAVREMIEDELDGSFLDEAFSALRASRPTAVNLFWLWTVCARHWTIAKGISWKQHGIQPMQLSRMMWRPAE